MYSAKEGHNLQRIEFANEYCLALEIPLVLMGFYHLGTRRISTSWVGRNLRLPAESLGDLTAFVVERIASLSARSEDVSDWPAERNAGTGRDQPKETWFRTETYTVGVGHPIGDKLPVLAFRNRADVEWNVQKIVRRFGLAFVSQQLRDDSRAPARLQQGMVSATLNMFSMELLVVGADRRIHYDGTTARAGLIQEFGWSIAEGRLDLSRGTASDALTGAIATAATGVAPCPDAFSVKVADGSTRAVIVAPFLDSPKGLTMIYFERESITRTKWQEMFFSNYNLTDAERNVARDLLAGKTVAQIAETSGRSTATVRSYLKQVLAKTETHRQSEFILLYYKTTHPIAGPVVGTADL